jgi:hypothetical protein
MAVGCMALGGGEARCACDVRGRACGDTGAPHAAASPAAARSDAPACADARPRGPMQNETVNTNAPCAACRWPPWSPRTRGSSQQSAPARALRRRRPRARPPRARAPPSAAWGPPSSRAPSRGRRRPAWARSRPPSRACSTRAPGSGQQRRRWALLVQKGATQVAYSVYKPRITAIAKRRCGLRRGALLQQPLGHR